MLDASQCADTDAGRFTVTQQVGQLAGPSSCACVEHLVGSGPAQSGTAEMSGGFGASDLV